MMQPCRRLCAGKPEAAVPWQGTRPPSNLAIGNGPGEIF